MLERDDVKPAWHEYTHHDFCKRMGDGTLPRETFKNYMIQDYLYLVGDPNEVQGSPKLIRSQVQFARANALASYKSTSLDDIAGVRYEHSRSTTTSMLTSSGRGDRYTHPTRD